MRKSNLIILLALAMGGIAAFMARSWIERHTRLNLSAAKARRRGGCGAVGVRRRSHSRERPEIPWTDNRCPRAVREQGRAVQGWPSGGAQRHRQERLVLRTKVTAPGQRASLSACSRRACARSPCASTTSAVLRDFILPGDRVDVVLLRNRHRRARPKIPRTF